MPSRYYCTQCQLGFQTGWFHYHRLIRNAMAATWLVCGTCGASFLLNHKYDDSPDELFGWGGPVNWVPTKHEGLYRHAQGTPEQHLIETDHDFRPIRDENEKARTQGLMDDLKLDDYECPYCQRCGTLTKEWNAENHQCPRCKTNEIEMVGSYIT